MSKILRLPTAHRARAVVALFATAVFLASPAVGPAYAKKIPLRVVYLARTSDKPRTEAFEKFLKEQFEDAAVVPRDEFDPASAGRADVVVLDWSQQERHDGKYKSPVGPLENCNKPIVMLGSAGLLMAGPWYVIGGAG